MKTNVEILNTVNYTSGANVIISLQILDGIKKDLAYRENTILQDLKSVEKNNSVPDGYVIYSFFDSKGNGFEAGKTPSGYSITC